MMSLQPGVPGSRTLFFAGLSAALLGACGDKGDDTGRTDGGTDSGRGDGGTHSTDISGSFRAFSQAP